MTAELVLGIKIQKPSGLLCILHEPLRSVAVTIMYVYFKRSFLNKKLRRVWKRKGFLMFVFFVKCLRCVSCNKKRTQDLTSRMSANC